MSDLTGQKAVSGNIRGVLSEIHPVYKIDTELNKEGYAADAKATGDAISGVSDDLTVHKSDKNNPHGVTAAQVGARPNDWMPSLADLGAAPSGYGLGGQCRWALNDLDLATESGFWAWQSTTANTPFAYGSVLVLNRNDTQITQIGIDPYMVGNGAIAVRHQNSNGWYDWAYLNPPMTLGVEYKTIERFKGQQVYVKAVSFASLPSSGSTGVAFGTGLNVISIEGVAYESKYVCPLGNCDKIGEVWYQVSDGKMYISVTGSSNYKAYVVVKYTKE